MDILFVDDDIDDREFFVDALSYVDASLKCVVAKSCSEALDILRSSATLPLFVFLDVHMPAMDGETCLHTIKNDPKMKNIKVVMYSNASDEALMESYKNAGATYFLIKPPTFKGLCDSLSLLLGR